ncbi:TauD/TfdA family dioxygenase [Streptomyces zhihengii]|uniref:TauD/TfdA family dioxygenase n=1 Tax=Streptomyces zhihengii TaxID=1818004 RepID=A0ABS2UX27_9ACTN|nr:TauD/TfdA family dioxygenase [Streptomyces zhihengii]MBM9621883.1 TauD/TfdA family dioxygenase [Streptomyces zhihengii]
METINAEKAAADAEPVLAALQARGYALLDVGGVAPESPQALEVLDAFLSALADPIQVFARYSTWRPIGVDLSREPHRSEGTGHSPLHTDFVNAEDPPEYVLLYCARADPAGGGDSLVARAPHRDDLPPGVAEVLSRKVYSHGQVTDLLNVGRDVNPFAVLDPQGGAFRYTGQLLGSCAGEEYEAIRFLDGLLRDSTVRLTLREGQAILLDQRRVVHGRGTLGTGQESIPQPLRRLLWQRFARPHAPERMKIQT